jgi:hypothetical protein
MSRGGFPTGRGSGGGSMSSLTATLDRRSALELKRELEKFPLAVQDKVARQALAGYNREVATALKARTPVRTGRLKRSDDWQGQEVQGRHLGRGRAQDELPEGPRAGGDWGACAPRDLRPRRRLAIALHRTGLPLLAEGREGRQGRRQRLEEGALPPRTRRLPPRHARDADRGAGDAAAPARVPQAHRGDRALPIRKHTSPRTIFARI